MARSADRFGDVDNLGLGLDLSGLNVKAVIENPAFSPSVAPGGAAQLNIVAGYKINGVATKFDPVFTVLLSSFEIEEPAPNGVTNATEGVFTAQVRMLSFDPNRTGVVRARGNDLKLSIQIVSQVSALLSTSLTMESRSAYTVRAMGGLLDTDPQTAPLRAAPVIAHNQDVLLTFIVAKGPDFIRDQSVAFSLSGAGTLDRTLGTTGSVGVVQVVYTAPGGGGAGTAIVRLDVTDGVVSGSEHINVRFQ